MLKEHKNVQSATTTLSTMFKIILYDDSIHENFLNTFFDGLF